MAQPLTSRERLPRLHADVGTVPGMAGAVTSKGHLEAGHGYVVRVRGSYSAYTRVLMRAQGTHAEGWHFCADRVGARGQDAEFTWVIPKPLGMFCPAFPIRHNLLLIDNGEGFEHLAPIDTLPEPTQLRRSNRYECLVIRKGSDGPLSVGIADSTITDNIGGFRVRPLRLADCTVGGWMLFNDTFASEEECVAVAP
jgi:hypothetical protein